MSEDHIPLSLYVHFPWCIKKCPYCDFNSHAISQTINDSIPEQDYIEALLIDLNRGLLLISDRPISSIFFGGGTPSLISGAGIEYFLTELDQKVSLKPDVEITLEANPGTVDADHFAQYRVAGINRLSMGMQSFRDQQLQQLGRIHSGKEAVAAFKIARNAGFENINLDLMFGLPGDDAAGSLSDLEQAIELGPEHISWYQLTMEPNTLFYQQRPTLPNDDLIWGFQNAGQSLLASSGYQQYEISAYARQEFQCQHNLNYWKFGDYLGIGAGAHSKISHFEIEAVIERFSKPRLPKQYMSESGGYIQRRTLSKRDTIMEFMMNALRLNQGFSIEEFESITGLGFSELDQTVDVAMDKDLLQQLEDQIKPTEKGSLFLNDLLEIFSA